jgi:hypothetical protein
MRPAIPIEDWDERFWQQQVVALARTLGYRSYHTLRSKGSQPGYPDLTLVRDRVVFLELKTESGKTTGKQKEWLSALERAGADVYVVRPRHMQALATVLGPTSTPSYSEARGELLLELDKHVTRQAITQQEAA